MSVSSKNLDSLLNTSFPGTDFTGVASKSSTDSSVTLTTTGGPGPGMVSTEVVKVVAVNDAANTVTLLILNNGASVGQLTEFVIGFSSQGLLLSLSDPTTAAQVLAHKDFGNFDDVSGVLSCTPIPAQTNITFTNTGSYNNIPPNEMQFIGELPQGQAARIYQAAFNRAPDAVGLNFWTSALKNGESLQKIALDFTLTTEGQSHFGAASNADFIGQLYQNVLGRPGEASGVRYWTGALDHGYGRGDALAAFSEGPENVSRFASQLATGAIHVSLI